MEEKKFLCSRVERGVTQCAVQCDECIKRVMDAQQPGPLPSEQREKHAAEEMAKRSAENAAAILAEQAQGPQIAAQIVITLWANGDFRVDGPMHDRILVRGMISLALDQEGNNFRDALTARRLKAEAAAKEPRWKRALRDRLAAVRAKLAASKNTAASAEADELKKALEQNAPPAKKIH